MSDPRHSLLLISDFNLGPFAGYLNNDDSDPGVRVQMSEFGQVIPALLVADAAMWDPSPDAAVVWTRPEAVLPGFADLLRFESVEFEQLEDELASYAGALLDMASRVRFAFVPTWVLPSYQQGHGLLDMRPNVGIAHALMRLNLRLAELLHPASNIYVLDAARWVQAAGRNAFPPGSWYLGKIPFGNEVFKAAMASVKSALSSLTAGARKLLVVDLDDTLWGGIVGDEGWENLRLGGHDHVGEAYVDFQHELRALKNRGVLLSIVSKNEESVALEAIREHPEMVLNDDDFVGWRINWQDKAANILALVEELNLGLQSVVFLDDSPIERARVREALPEVLVPEWPGDATRYRQALLELRVFDTPTLTDEDARRTNMYRAERARKAERVQLTSIDDWIESLDIRVEAARLTEPDLGRATQLLNKTNQMNLATRRMSESEFSAWAGTSGHALYTFRVSDKFGDSGLTGLLGLQTFGNTTLITDFVLSCRVMGRRVEEAMLHCAVEHARAAAAGVEHVVAGYGPTPKNVPCLAFWRRSGFDEEPEHLFRWPASKLYPLPDAVTLDRSDRAGS
ncbi:MAG: HAD-IIIC family phosphatase [Gemmatimonadota bacterium]